MMYKVLVILVHSPKLSSQQKQTSSPTHTYISHPHVVIRVGDHREIISIPQRDTCGGVSLRGNYPPPCLNEAVAPAGCRPFTGN